MVRNKVILIGRLTDNPDVRYTSGSDGQLCIARYTLAVGRNKKDETDFIRCVGFGQQGEFAEKYLSKGTKIAIEGRIQTGSYDDKDGKKIYTTDVVVENHEFCESKGTNKDDVPPKMPEASAEGFMNVSGGGDLPFKK